MYDFLLLLGVVSLSVVMFLLGRLSMIPVWRRRIEEMEEHYRELDRLAEAEYFAMEQEYRREMFQDHKLMATIEEEEEVDEDAEREQAKWDRAEQQRDNEIYQERW